MNLLQRPILWLVAGLVSIAILMAGDPSVAQSDSPPEDDSPAVDGSMTIDDIEVVIGRLDADYERNGDTLLFVFAEYELLLVSDPQADRMRIMVPINDAAGLDAKELLRLMQANFDSALDARYAIANDILWGTFIHRLSTLSEIDLLSGIGQTINIADSFGTSYSSGELVYGGGDSQDLQRRQLIDELQKKGKESI